MEKEPKNIIHQGYVEHPAPDKEDSPPPPSPNAEDEVEPSEQLTGSVIETEDDVRIPISAETAEEALLGIFMQDEDAATLIAQSGLQEEHFLRRRNKLLYSIVLSVRLNQRTCNVDFVMDECEKRSLPNGQTYLDFIGASTLTEMIELPVATDIKTTEGYIKIVFEQWRLSKIKELARQISAFKSFEESKIVDKLAMLQSVVADTSIQKYGLVGLGHLLPDAYNRFLDRLAHPERYIGIKTGFYWIDKCRAVAKKRTCIVAAKTNRGKSIFVGNMLVEMMEAGNRILLFTPELDKEEYIDRIICSSANVEIDEWKKAVDLREPELERIRKLQSDLLTNAADNLYIEDRGSQTVNYILSSIKRHMLNRPVDIVVVDYIQKLRFYKENIRREVDDALDKLSSFAKDNDIALILVSQLKRTKNPEPELEDLKESGNLENFADSVVLLHRKSLTKLSERQEGYYKVEKNREGRTTNGAVRLRFNEHILKFTEADPPPVDDVSGFKSLTEDPDQPTEQSVNKMVKEFDENYGET